MKIYDRIWRPADQACVLCSYLFEISAPLLSARRPERRARLPFLLVLFCIFPVGGQLTGALIEYVVKHSARHYFTVIVGTPRLLQVLIILRTCKRT